MTLADALLYAAACLAAINVAVVAGLVAAWRQRRPLDDLGETQADPDRHRASLVEDARRNGAL